MMKNDLQKAVTLLKSGGLVAMPTETVYGLAADARNKEALKKIFQAKNRPIDHPLIVHIGDMTELNAWAIEISDLALQVAHAFWPGPLTLILKKAPAVLDIVTGGQETVGIRIPNHPVAKALLTAFGGGVAAPSANRFGRISPTTAAAVREELGDQVDLILEGGQCEVGVESTILDMSGDTPRILRPGMISEKEIEAVLHQHLSHSKKTVPRVSGSLESHYAPLTKTCLMDRKEIENFLNEIDQKELPIAIMLRGSRSFAKKTEDNIFIVEMLDEPKAYAHDLYQMLRDLDHRHFKQIIIEKVPTASGWEAVYDRVVRAAG